MSIEWLDVDAVAFVAKFCVEKDLAVVEYGSVTDASTGKPVTDTNLDRLFSKAFVLESAIWMIVSNNYGWSPERYERTISNSGLFLRGREMGGGQWEVIAVAKEALPRFRHPEGAIDEGEHAVLKGLLESRLYTNMAYPRGTKLEERLMQDAQYSASEVRAKETAAFGEKLKLQADLQTANEKIAGLERELKKAQTLAKNADTARAAAALERDQIVDTWVKLQELMKSTAAHGEGGAQGGGQM